MSGLLVVLSSPSGGGKTTIARRLVAQRDDVAFSVSATTRPRRGAERDGVDYQFLTPDAFARREAAGKFLETATYRGHRYGTLASEVNRIRDAGQHALLDIEVDGARQVRQRFPDSVHVFVLPPSAAALRARLSARDTEDPSGVVGRLIKAVEEVEAASEYDYVVINDDVDRAVEQIGAILDGETHRVTRVTHLADMIETFRRDVAREAAALRDRVGQQEQNS